MDVLLHDAAEWDPEHHPGVHLPGSCKEGKCRVVSFCNIRITNLAEMVTGSLVYCSPAIARLVQGACIRDTSDVSLSEHPTQARKDKALLDSWGEFKCSNTGGWTPVDSENLAWKDHFWCSLGVATRLKAAIKLNPAFANTRLPAFTEEELQQELIHVRSAASF